jgi:predicted outer membrane protein
MMTELKTLKGPAFDQKFLEMVIAGHQRELARLDAAMNQTSTDGLKLMLSAIRPAMQTHLDTARTLQQETPRT